MLHTVNWGEERVGQVLSAYFSCYHTTGFLITTVNAKVQTETSVHLHTLQTIRKMSCGETGNCDLITEQAKSHPPLETNAIYMPMY